jgi:hypothetical protein
MALKNRTAELFATGNDVREDTRRRRDAPEGFAKTPTSYGKVVRDKHSFILKELDLIAKNIFTIKSLHSQKLAAVGQAELERLRIELEYLDRETRDSIAGCNSMLKIGLGDDRVYRAGERLRDLTLELSRIQVGNDLIPPHQNIEPYSNQTRRDWLTIIHPSLL